MMLVNVTAGNGSFSPRSSPHASSVTVCCWYSNHGAPVLSRLGTILAKTCSHKALYLVFHQWLENMSCGFGNTSPRFEGPALFFVVVDALVVVSVWVEACTYS